MTRVEYEQRKKRTTAGIQTVTVLLREEKNVIHVEQRKKGALQVHLHTVPLPGLTFASNPVLVRLKVRVCGLVSSA